MSRIIRQSKFSNREVIKKNPTKIACYSSSMYSKKKTLLTMKLSVLIGIVTVVVIVIFVIIASFFLRVRSRRPRSIDSNCKWFQINFDNPSTDAWAYEQKQKLVKLSRCSPGLSSQIECLNTKLDAYQTYYDRMKRACRPSNFYDATDVPSFNKFIFLHEELIREINHLEK